MALAAFAARAIDMTTLRIGKDLRATAPTFLYSVAFLARLNQQGGSKCDS